MEAEHTDNQADREALSNGVRINKYLSEAGVCSRREADREIAAGHVAIDGKIAAVGDRVYPGMDVSFCGKTVCPEEEEILLAFHKPAGIVCTADKREKDNIIDYIHYPKRIYPVGRLDKRSEGLILLTNRGDLVNRILRAGNYHEKEYDVTVDRDLTDKFLDAMRMGIYLKELDVTTRSCEVIQTGARTFTIVLTQGLNRQIRRMCEACGYRVLRLVRVRVLNILLGDLPAGSWREVTPAEREELERLIRDSYSAPRTAETVKDDE
ncbi:MAG: pseudouridine synthase [Lachnospiraceae bacterium]|nr:pseudouridine synthase [Lachnospiraceae bacterium]